MNKHVIVVGIGIGGLVLARLAVASPELIALELQQPLTSLDQLRTESIKVEIELPVIHAYSYKRIHEQWTAVLPEGLYDASTRPWTRLRVWESRQIPDLMKGDKKVIEPKIRSPVWMH